MDVSVALHCDRCGSANVSLPADGDDEGAVACNDCGTAHGSFADLKAELVACARAHGAEALRIEAERLNKMV
jgi:uncharacterized Zn finger protein